MKKENLKKWHKPKMKVISVSIRITKNMSKWLSENDYSPTGIFMEACKDLGFKE